MKFNRYIKLRNHYDAKNLSWWLTWNHGLRDAKYVATEKLHGSNFSVWVYPDATIRTAKRSGFLNKDSSFYRWNEAMDEPQLVEWLKSACAFVARRRQPLCFYGELFGAGVQKEINYGPIQRIRFFDVYDPELDEYWSPAAMYEFIPETLRVPHVGFYAGINSALACDDAFLSLINPVEGNICEGVVIRPFNKTYQTDVGERFVIKKKNDKFKEKAKVAKRHKSTKEIPKEVLASLDIITPYITPQRLSNVISHEGEPTGMEQFASYLRSFIQDVRDDCLLENPHFDDGLDKKGRQTVWKTVGTHCSIMLKAYMINK